MGFFDRLRYGWRLAQQSLRVVWNDRTLLFFPLFSASSTLLATGAFYFGIGPQEVHRILNGLGGDAAGPQASPLSYALVFLAYFTLYIVTIYFNVALVGAAEQSIGGKDTSPADGFRVANQHLGSVVAWATISGTVGLLLSLIENDRRGGRWIRTLLGTAWSIVTYFVIPVMIFKGTSAFGAIGRSTTLMRESWGENVGAQFSLGGFFVLITLPVFLLVVAVFAFLPELALPTAALAVLYGACIWVLGQTAKSVLTVALYEFATRRQIARGFDTQALDGAFRPL